MRHAVRAFVSHGSPPSAFVQRRMMIRPTANRATAMSRARMGSEDGGCPSGMKAQGPALSDLPRRMLDHGQLFEGRRRGDAGCLRNRDLLRRVSFVARELMSTLAF